MSPYRESARNNLADLNDDELGVLAKLIRCLVRTDGDISGSERDQVEQIANDTGRDDFWNILDVAAESSQDQGAILKEAESIGVKDAQELIYGALYELSIVDASGDGENELLTQLASIWQLEIKDVPPES